MNGMREKHPGAFCRGSKSVHGSQFSFLRNGDMPLCVREVCQGRSALCSDPRNLLQRQDSSCTENFGVETVIEALVHQRGSPERA